MYAVDSFILPSYRVEGVIISSRYRKKKEERKEIYFKVFVRFRSEICNT
jgi:hypothetical protein